MKNLKYDLMTADLDYGVKLHPQSDMKRLGYEVIKSEPVPIGDCWWFRVKNEIDNPPGYIVKLSDEFKFSDEYDDNNEEERKPPRTPPEFKEDGSLTDYGKYKRGLNYKTEI